MTKSKYSESLESSHSTASSRDDSMFVDGAEGLFACVEHEMNTPLAAALSAVQTMSLAAAKLSDDEVAADPKRRARCVELMGTAERSATAALERMRETLARLRDVAAEPDPNTIRRISVFSCVEQAVAAINEGRDGVDLELSVRTDQDTFVHGSPRRLQQLFVDLLQNAVDASGPGARIEVEIRVTGSTVETVVRDQGRGIDEAAMASLFEPKVRLRGRSVGSSLGLAIAKRVAEGHRGELRVESEPNQGTVVTLALPRKEAG